MKMYVWRNEVIPRTEENYGMSNYAVYIQGCDGFNMQHTGRKQEIHIEFWLKETV